MRDAGTKSIPLKALFGGRSSSAPGGEASAREGLRVGRYELLTPIARGGMAEVWSARFLGDLGFSRVVALKVIRPEYAEDASFRSAFLEEARIAGRLRHANVIEVLELGEEGPLLFQAMALIEGESASRLIREHRTALGGLEPQATLPLAISMRIVLDMLAGLHAAHEITDDDGVPMRLVHRDVSPHNILVGIDGVAKLGDFGVAKFLGRKMIETDHGQVRGKPGYLSPEQLERKPIDRRTDIFAAGVVVWEMITGKKLFRTDEQKPALADPLEGPIPDPREHASQLAPAIAEVAVRALARDPNARFQTAQTMADALEQAAIGAGALGTARDVARLVNALCGARVEAEREEIRRAIKGGHRASPPRTDTEPAPVRPFRAAIEHDVQPSSPSMATAGAQDLARDLALPPDPTNLRRGLAQVAGVQHSTQPTIPTDLHDTEQMVLERRRMRPKQRSRARKLIGMVALLVASAVTTAVVTAIVIDKEDPAPQPNDQRVEALAEGVDTATVSADAPDRAEKPAKPRRGRTNRRRQQTKQR